MDRVDAAIAMVENLYTTVTGTTAPQNQGVYAPLLPEKDPQKQINEQIDRLMQTLDNTGGNQNQNQPVTPPIHVSESETDIQIQVAIPGFSKNEVNLDYSGSNLVITGQRQNQVTSGYQTMIAEFEMYSFRREIPLPTYANIAEVIAKIQDGVLTIQMPKTSVPGENRNLAVK